MLDRLSNVCCVNGNDTASDVDVIINALLLLGANLLYCPAGKSHVPIAATIITNSIKVSGLGRPLGLVILTCMFWKIDYLASSHNPTPGERAIIYRDGRLHQFRLRNSSTLFISEILLLLNG